MDASEHASSRRASLSRAVLLGFASGLLVNASALSAEFEGETIVFGGDAAYPPFEWIDDGAPRGFDVDLAEALVNAGGAHAEFHLDDWPNTVRALEAGDVDVVAMFQSEIREQRFHFTPPFHYVNHGIFGRADSANVTSLVELEGATVALEELSYAHQHMVADDFPGELVLTSNTLRALEAVANGQADYAILAAPPSNYLIRSRELPLSTVGPPLWPRGYAFAVRRDRPALAEWLTEQFYAALRTGAYQEIYERWEEQLAPTEEGPLSRILSFAMIPLGIIAVVGLTWAIKLRRSLVARTKRLIAETKRRRAAESHADWRTNHDVYTDLPRLHHFSKLVGDSLTRIDSKTAPAKQIVALRPADLDRRIRTLGHEAGLSAMRDFVERLRSMEFEAYGQTGRDVFLVFGDKAHIDKQLRSVLSPTDTWVMESLPLPRLYAGAAVWPKHGRTVADLVRRAETALAVAIERKEGWCEYRRSMDPDESALQLIETFRETAGAGLYPVFQPQVEIRTGQLVGAEALVRWDAPGFGNVPPDRFIPLLEDAGLICHVTRRMLRDAVRVGAQLRASGMPCPISVNVAVADLLTDKTRKGIFKALRAHGGKAEDLKLELTETSVAEQPETVGWVITRLRDSGIRTAIDDFGTGYSSLSYLSEFPIQEVKIDMSFIRGMGRSAKDRSIVRSTIAMAHELGLITVAEGVERQDDIDILCHDDCDRAQGYFYSRPLPEAEFLAFVRDYVARVPSSSAQTG